MYKSLVVSSKDRLAGSTSSTNFSVSLTEPIVGATGADLLWFIAPNATYNITSANNVIPFYTGGIGYSVSIAAGSYTGQQLLQAVITAMNTVGPGTITGSFNTPAGVFSFGNGGVGFQFLWKSGTNAANSMWYVLGFTQADTTLAPSQTGSNVAQLNGPLFFYIYVDKFGRSGISTNSTLDIFTFAVPISGNFGDVINLTGDMLAGQTVRWGSALNTNQLNIALTTNGNTAVNLNGTDWAFQVRFRYD